MAEECCCCGEEVKTFPDTSKVENPITSKDKITKEFIKELESYAISLGLNEIGYTNDLTDLRLNNEGSQFKNAIVLTMKMTPELLNAKINGKAQNYNMELYEEFGKLTYQVSDFLRFNGYETYTAHPYDNVLKFSKLGEHAGLGGIGKSGLLITSDVGPQIKVSAILVNIKNLPKRNNTDFSWIPNYCNECGKCIKYCPMKALKDNRENNLDADKCIGCSNGCTQCIKICPFYSNDFQTLKDKL